MGLLAALLAATVMAPSFVLTSSGFSDGAVMPTTFEYSGNGCTGDDQSPPLHWSGAPAGTKSFALTVHDPDAKASGGWWHWVMFDLPSSVDTLAESAGSGNFSLSPKGSVQAFGSSGTLGYHGPCPPVGSGVHHYNFTLYALDVANLDLSTKLIDGPYVTATIAAHTLGTAKLTGLFSRR